MIPFIDSQPQRLKLPHAEAAMHGKAADLEFTLAFDDGKYNLEILDTGEDVPLKEGQARQFYGTISASEAAALTFLFVANDGPDLPEIVKACYDHLKDLPFMSQQNLRPVP